MTPNFARWSVIRVQAMWRRVPLRIKLYIPALLAFVVALVATVLPPLVTGPAVALAALWQYRLYLQWSANGALAEGWHRSDHPALVWLWFSLYGAIRWAVTSWSRRSGK